MSTVKEYVLELGDQKMTFQTGLLANQANASIICRMGDTVVMSNCTVSAKARDNVDFLPLQVVYQEKFYAGGKIGGSRFRKREGRPADDYVLLARVIDRGLRPMFPKHMHNDIQVFCTVLSYDFEHEHDIAAANAAALAVAISDCPADGPIATVRVGLIGGELVLNPSREAREKGDLDMFVTASLERIVMIEAGANQVPEEEVLRAIEFGKKWAQKIARFIADIQKEIGKKKMEIEAPYEHAEALKFLSDWALSDITKAIKTPMPKLERRAIFNGLMDQAADKLKEKFGAGSSDQEKTDMVKLQANGKVFVDKVIKKEVRRLILEEGIRMSSRKIEEIRPISALVDILPNRVHGSALFQRGETQGLTRGGGGGGRGGEGGGGK